MDIVGAVAHLTTVATRGIDVGNHQQVVATIVLNHTRALKESGLIGLALEELCMRALDYIREVGLELHHLASTIDNIYTIVVVEEERTVVEVTHA